MENKNLIAQALLDIARNSETTFIEVSEDKELIDTAKKLGLLVPSPDLSVFKTVYAEIDKVNLNGIVLPKEAVMKGLPTLIGKQINWEHDGAGRVCGYIIDAKINEDKIEIIGVIFKSLFPEEMDEVKVKFEKKTLAVSFEIWNVNPADGTSVVHNLENGFRAIDPITFHGCGLLLVHPPACPKAKVYKLVAALKAEDTKTFEENLVCASMAIEEPKCKNCGTCTCDQEKEVKIVEEVMDNDYEGGEIDEAKKLTTEQRNALPDSDFALIQEKDGKKIRRFPINDEAHVRNALARLPQAKDITEEEKKSALEKILKKAKELNMEEIVKKYEKSEERLCPECKQPMKDEDVEMCAECLKKKNESASTSTETKDETKPAETGAETKAIVEVKKEEVAQLPVAECPCTEEEKPVKVISEYVSTCVDTYDEATNSYKSESVGHTKTTKIFKDGREVVEESNNNSLYDSYVEKYTITKSELEEKVIAAKTEKDTEISTLKTDFELERANLKIETENLDKEIKKLKDELDKKNQEIAELKAPKVEEKKEKELTVGAVEGEKNSEIKRMAANVNKIITESKGK